MEWFIFALIAPVLWGLNNVVMKILLDKRFNKPFPFLVLSTFMDMFFIATIFLLTNVSFYFPYNLIPIAIAGMNLISFWFYFKSVSTEEISMVTSLAQTIPIFVAIMSAVLLNEVLMTGQYLGIVVIVVASMLISYKNVEGKRHLSPAFLLMMGFALVVGVQIILTKYTLQYMDYWSLFFWQGIGYLITSSTLMMLPKIRKDFIKIISTLDKKTLSAVFLNEGLWVAGTLASLVAMSVGYVSLVSSIATLQPLFVLIYTVLLSLLVPKLLKEDISRYNFSRKLFAIILIFIGMWLLNVL